MQGEPGAGVTGQGSLTPLPKPGLVRHSPRRFPISLPIPLAHAAPEVGPVEHQALLHGPTGERHDPLFRPGRRAKGDSRLLLKRRTRGL